MNIWSIWQGLSSLYMNALVFWFIHQSVHIPQGLPRCSFSQLSLRLPMRSCSPLFAPSLSTGWGQSISNQLWLLRIWAHLASDLCLPHRKKKKGLWTHNPCWYAGSFLRIISLLQKSGLCWWYSSYLPIPQFLAHVFIYLSNHFQGPRIRRNTFREHG